MRRSKTAPLQPISYICPACHRVLVQAVTSEGTTLLLDTGLVPLWVITGRETAEGVPIVAQSRGYTTHHDPCQGGTHA